VHRLLAHPAKGNDDDYDVFAMAGGRIFKANAAPVGTHVDIGVRPRRSIADARLCREPRDGNGRIRQHPRLHSLEHLRRDWPEQVIGRIEIPDAQPVCPVLSFWSKARLPLALKRREFCR
jgi:hypothetical protein